MKTTEINPIIDNARFTGFHGMVVLLCALLLGEDNAWTRSGLAQGPLAQFPPEPWR